MMPDARSAATAAHMLDLLLEFFEDGKYWMKSPWQLFAAAPMS
jgi:hypothetical protein